MGVEATGRRLAAVNGLIVLGVLLCAHKVLGGAIAVSALTAAATWTWSAGLELMGRKASARAEALRPSPYAVSPKPDAYSRRARASAGLPSATR